MADIDRLEHNGVPELLRKQVDIGSSRYAEVGAAVLTDSTGALITSSNPLPIASTGPAAGTATSATTSVASSATVVTLQAANAGRRGWAVINIDANKLHVRMAAGATTSNCVVQLAQGDYYEMPEPIYAGIITGIWEADGAGAAICEERT